MPHDQKSFTGQVSDIFFHRFVVVNGKTKILADIGPKAAEILQLKEGDKVVLEGEMKPSELKVHSISINGGKTVEAHHPDKHKFGPGHEHEHEHADPKPALDTAKANGFTVLGQPRRKPKHFEILGRDEGGDLVELHIELDGSLRKTKPVNADDDKWGVEIRKAG